MSAANRGEAEPRAIVAPSAAARRWARREVRRLVAMRADAGLLSATPGHRDPAYGLELAPAVREVVADLTPDRAAALVEDLLFCAHFAASTIAAGKGGNAREHAPIVVDRLLQALDTYDPIPTP